jgi:presenilin 1
MSLDKYQISSDVEAARTTTSPSSSPTSNYMSLQNTDDDTLLVSTEQDGLMRRADSNDDDDSSDDNSQDSRNGTMMSLEELLYSSSSYNAIAKPVTLTMILAALTVVFINTDETRAQGQAAMAQAYQVWNVSDASSGSDMLALSLANALVMVSVICGMTFGIVLLYKFRCMMCLIGYMMFCSSTLLGVLGGNLLQTALTIYQVPVDKLTFAGFLWNFAIVGVAAVFWGQGIPKVVTQGYLIATSVILAWHLSYFDAWTTWTLLFMLALYDLCAVLTPCGPLRALVNLMSQDDSPEMPGLLFEADLPAEAKRPGIPRTSNTTAAASRTAAGSDTRSQTGETHAAPPQPEAGLTEMPETTALSAVGDTTTAPADTAVVVTEEPIVHIPLAIAKVYNLVVLAVPENSLRVMYPQRYAESNISASPLLQATDSPDAEEVSIPADPSPEQLRAIVSVRLPQQGGRIEQVSRRGKRVYLERDRHGNPKRILWVDRHGKVFAEMKEDDDDAQDQPRNSIRLGLGDFIFYSVLVAKAAQYSFATFAACMLVILAGLGGTLVLLSVYHHALPALPISILLGIFFYVVTRLTIEPWIEAVLTRPVYV